VVFAIPIAYPGFVAADSSTRSRELLMRSSINRRQWLQQSCAAVGLALPAAVLQRTILAKDAEEPFDVLIVGGTLVDGSGSPRSKGDLGIRSGRIAALGDLKGRPAKRTLDAAGRLVAPGFIDMHTHSDRTLLRDGTAQSAVRQGATTHVIGNCGSSPAPLPETSKLAKKDDDTEGDATGKRTYRTFGEFLQALKDTGTSINVCALVGHNRVRATVMGYDERRPTEGELARMKDLVVEAMRSGAIGLSTGLVSPPGTYSETDEIVELARAAAARGGVYASHIRGEASSLMDAVTEAILIGRRAKLPVQISHHKAAGKENWGSTRHTLRAIEEANQAGQTVRVDVYPYRAGSAGLSQLVPPWAHEGGTARMLERLADAKTREKIARDMEQGAPGWKNFFRIDWQDIQITQVRSEANRKWVGRRVADVAKARGIAGVQACIDLVLEERGEVGMINFIMDEDEMRGVLKHRLSMIGSDGSALNAKKAEGQPHPRSYGCFPRVLGKYVREEKLISLETAIAKMTSMPAAQLGLADRGLLKVGHAADVVVFDAERIIDRATFDDPHQYPDGIDSVLVNGELVVHGGEHLGAKPGRLLRPQRG
jgi:N-acyl-D-amino-acid deacylase